MNPYITHLGDIFPELANLAHELYQKEYFYNKGPKYKEGLHEVTSYAATGLKESTSIFTDDEYFELARRLRDNFNSFDNWEEKKQKLLIDKSVKPSIARFIQNNIIDDYINEITNTLPEFIKKQNITFMIQIADNGKFIPIHSDHERKSSLFYLLTEPAHSTNWYEPNFNFNLFKTRIVSPSDVSLTHTEIIQQGIWYAFNNSAFHSVVNLTDDIKVRVSFLVEFVDLAYKDLLLLLQENNLLTQSINKRII